MWVGIATSNPSPLSSDFSVTVKKHFTFVVVQIFSAPAAVRTAALLRSKIDCLSALRLGRGLRQIKDMNSGKE